MIAVDTNLLVYAHREDSQFHQAAKQIISSLREGRVTWAIPWQCIHEFIGVVTHPRIYRSPTTTEQAFSTLNTWTAAGNVEFLAESTSHIPKLREICVAARVIGPRIHDARIAALCLCHGVRELWTADRDFSAFPQLKTLNPLVQR